MVAKAPDSTAALRLAGLDWNVVQKDIVTVDGSTGIPGFKANMRDIDGSVLGIVTDRYRVVQNAEAFSFTDALLGEGVRYETAGSLQGGRRTWVLARLPRQYIINGEEISPYLVFMNAHDGSGAIKAAMTPIWVVCQNTLNLALSTAKRSWSLIVQTRTGKGNTATNLEHRMATIFHNAGLSDLSGGLHIFRRTFASRQYEKGVRVKEIAAYIGDLESTTEKYYIAVRKKRIVEGKVQQIVELPKAFQTDETEKKSDEDF